MLSNKTLGICGVAFFLLGCLPAIATILDPQSAALACRKLCNMSYPAAIVWLVFMALGIYINIQLMRKKD